MITYNSDTEFPKAYDHHLVEEKLYQFWQDKGYFTPIIDRGKNPFVIIMPPPNVTGQLHLGHALTASIQDAMARWHRMKGDPTLWLPGTDHAGIATQVVVERTILGNEGKTRHELGREKFTEKVWDWVSEYGNTIDRQHQRLGASCDWTRKRFTLDPAPSKAVLHTFVNLYRKGLIYQGERIINWCPRCETALSDLEVKHQDEDGNLVHIRYPIQDSKQHIIVATTRPETMLGDTAIAVHPDNLEYANLVGKKVVLPITQRVVPIIADEAVEIGFGTGALKVTPGHDPVDFEIGQRHNLSIVNIMNQDGTLNEEAGPYVGLNIQDARKAVMERLSQEGLLDKTEAHQMSIGHCDRCDSVVEPVVSKQWFMKMKPLAKPAIEAINDGSISIVPQRFTRVYLNWMENIRDWCISRQIWWGHRIPVWYCETCEEITVEIETPIQCESCGSTAIKQDPDVLDTWFSSGLWTHSTLGWPEKTEDLSYFYPSTVMETGHDILFFWVARMIMLGLENTGKIPFKTIYLHGLVLDAQGSKMSKSRGNVLDPLQLIETYGADALRFALTTGTTPGNDSRLSDDKLDGARNFANKLWNISRFVVGSLKQARTLSGWATLQNLTHREDRWILSRHNRLIERVDQLISDFQFGEAQRELYSFVWAEFADWYIEMAKVRIGEGDQQPAIVLGHVLESTLRLLHPFMPFLTEELWQRLTSVLPKDESESESESISIAPYPLHMNTFIETEAEHELETIIGIIHGVRNLRAELKVEAQHTLEAIITTDSAITTISEECEAIRKLARINVIDIIPSSQEFDKSGAVSLVVGNATVFIYMPDTFDLSSEQNRLKQELLATEKLSKSLNTRINDTNFTSRAPIEVVERERERLETSLERENRIRELIIQLGV
tara:strand:- start:5922 stop:8603 length:2682 start_codon:yes stop_codon:yes gene_type:complete